MVIRYLFLLFLLVPSNFSHFLDSISLFLLLFDAFFKKNNMKSTLLNFFNIIVICTSLNSKSLELFHLQFIIFYGYWNYILWTATLFSATPILAATILLSTTMRLTTYIWYISEIMLYSSFSIWLILCSLVFSSFIYGVAWYGFIIFKTDNILLYMYTTFYSSIHLMMPICSLSCQHKLLLRFFFENVHPDKVCGDLWASEFHFLDNYWCYAYFHRIIDHFNAFFREM